MKRTDIYRPSAINPADFDYVAFDYIKIEGMFDCARLTAERSVKAAHMAKTGGKYSQHEHGGSCHICGASALYTVTFWNRVTNEYIRTGHDCAQKMSFGMGDFDAFHRAVSDALEARAGKKKALVILENAGVGEAWGIYTGDRTAFKYEEVTLSDIVSKLVKYGAVSDKSIDYLRILLNKIADRPRVDAQRAEEYALANDAPEGRVTVVGEVVSAKWQESHFGEQYKMLVKHGEGWKVWVTVPVAFGQVNKGDFVTFVATLKRSKDDSKFAFGSRPTGKSIVPKPTRDASQPLAMAQKAGV